MISLPSVATHCAAAEPTTESAQSDIQPDTTDKYEPIIDWLHTDKSSAERKQVDTLDTNARIAGTNDIPKDLLDKTKPKLYDESVPDDITYDDYYTIKDGKRTKVSKHG